MSGGHFDYAQHRLTDIADEIDSLIESNDDGTLDEFGGKIGRDYSPQTIEKFRETVRTLRKAAEMAHRVDWLVSGDDSEESFHRRWGEEVRAVDAAVAAKTGYFSFADTGYAEYETINYYENRPTAEEVQKLENDVGMPVVVIEGRIIYETKPDEVNEDD